MNSYSQCPHCGRKVIKEYPKSIHQKCLERWAKGEIKADAKQPAKNSRQVANKKS